MVDETTARPASVVIPLPAAAIVIAALLAPSLIWIFRDRSVWTWDQAWYGEVTADLYRLLTSDPRHWAGLMLHAFGAKAPGIAWLGQLFVPIGPILGSRMEPPLLVSVLLCQAGTLWLIWHIGRLLAPTRLMIAVVGTVFAGGAPLFVGMSHQYLVEPMQTFGVSLAFLAALRATKSPPVTTLGLLLAAAAIGMCAKSSTPLYVLVPVIIALWPMRKVESWYSAAAPSRAIAILCAVSILLLLATALWYAINLKPLLQHIKDATVSDAVLDYGSRRPFFDKAAYWFAASKASFAPYYLLEAIIGVFVAGLIWAAVKRPVVRDARAVFAIGAGLQIVIVFVTLSFTINEETRFLSPLLPALAICLMSGLSRLRSRLLAGVFLVLASANAAWSQAHAAGLFPPDPNISAWVLPFTLDDADYRRAQAAEAATCTAADGGRINVVAVEYPELNANSIAFYSAMAGVTRGYRCYYTSLGYAETDAAKAEARIQTMETAFVITVPEDQQAPADFLNRISLTVLHDMEASPDFRRISLPQSDNLLIFRNLAADPQ